MNSSVEQDLVALFRFSNDRDWNWTQPKANLQFGHSWGILKKVQIKQDKLRTVQLTRNWSAYLFISFWWFFLRKVLRDCTFCGNSWADGYSWICNIFRHWNLLYCHYCQFDPFYFLISLWNKTFYMTHMIENFSNTLQFHKVVVTPSEFWRANLWHICCSYKLV